MGKTEREEELRRIRQERLEEAKQKLYWSEGRVRDLIGGIISIFAAIGIIILFYGALWGKFSEVRQGEQVIITNPNGFTSVMVTVFFALVILSVLGGFEIGRYVQTEFTKRRRQRQPQPPPPPP